MTFDDSSCTLNIIEEKQSVPEEEKQCQLFFCRENIPPALLENEQTGVFHSRGERGFFPIVFGGIPYSVP